MSEDIIFGILLGNMQPSLLKRGKRYFRKDIPRKTFLIQKKNT